MPTIDELRTKWFLNFQGGGAMLPVLGYPARHAGTAVTDFTDANLITALIDGKAFMEQWHRAIRELIALPNPAASEVWHANWSTNDVRTLGYRNPASDARQVLFDAHSAGIQLRGLLSAHVGKEIFTHNIRMIDWLSQHGISTFFLDDRFPPSGSIHQKFTCIRRDPANTKSFLGSGDISTDRWDLNTHPVFDPDRNPMNPTPTHDVGVLIQGPAVADIETTFKERWNDPVMIGEGLHLLPKIAVPVSTPPSPPGASHSVQVVHTYGRSHFGNSWSRQGEFTLWASYMNAISRASEYIYIEDQYFIPFDWEICARRADTEAQKSDLFFLLGEAILNRNVKVLSLVPSHSEEKFFGRWQKPQRDQGIEYLKVRAEASISGDFVIASLANAGTPIFVHSKLMIVDDEFVLVGTGNFNQRSMTFDSEIHLGIVDGNNSFAKELRKSLWVEHLQVTPADVDDPLDGYRKFKGASVHGQGRVVPYVYIPDTPVPLLHGPSIRRIDPYGGPDATGRPRSLW